MKRTHYLFVLPLLLACLSCNNSKIENEVSSSRLMEMVNELSSEPYGGRSSGSSGHKLAGDLLVTEFSNLGLQPFFSDTYLQDVPVELNEIENVLFATETDTTRIVHRLGADFTCRGFSGTGKVTGPMVFCGYGTPDSYHEIDVTNSVVLVFKASAPSPILNMTEMPLMPRDKARIAVQHGAKAIVFLPQPNDRCSAEAQGSVYDGLPPHLYTFPMLQLSADFAGALFARNGLNFAETKHAIDSIGKPTQISLQEKATIEVSASYTPTVQSQNIAAVLEGSDPKLREELIIVGAHIDHIGKQAGLIFPGANDNASGVAAVHEIAAILSKHKEKVKRSVVFVIFTGEELGMLGSKFFVQNLTPNQKVVAMLNFDCVADGESISVRGKASIPILYKIMKEEDNKLNKLVAPETILAGGADAEAFYRVGIPTLYFTTTNGYRHLHVASDSPETFNNDLFTEITKLGLKTTLRLASGEYDGEVFATEQ